uniref:Uncharacterized protein LOC103329902 n=1 Tax=Rhizophora mucronata TaxID=61149 RepID=A0A2P2MVI8_RHIMU
MGKPSFKSKSSFTAMPEPAAETEAFAPEASRPSIFSDSTLSNLSLLCTAIASDPTWESDTHEASLLSKISLLHSLLCSETDETRLVGLSFCSAWCPALESQGISALGSTANTFSEADGGLASSSFLYKES